jgi:hypothetical protein
MVPDTIPARFLFPGHGPHGASLSKRQRAEAAAHDSSADLLLPTRSRWLLHIGVCRNLGQIADHSHDEKSPSPEHCLALWRIGPQNNPSIAHQ